MSISECHEIGEGRGAMSEYQNGQLVYKDTRVWRAIASTQNHTGTEILLLAQTATPDPVPADVATHPYESSMRVKTRSATQEIGEGVAANTWKIVVTYDNQTSDADSTDSETPPLDRRTKFHLEFASFTRILERDIDGNPIANTAGDIFDPPLEEEDERPVLVATKNYDADDLDGLMALLADYRGAVNSDTWLGRPSGSWRLARVQMSPEQVENDQRYHAVSYFFELKEEWEIADPSTVEGTPEPWDRLVENKGFNYLTVANDKESRVPFNTKEPRWLEEDGTLFLPSADPGYFYRTFRTKKRRPFSALNLV